MIRTGTKLAISAAVMLAGSTLAFATRNEAFLIVSVLGFVVASLYARDLLRERGLPGGARAVCISDDGVTRDLGGGKREHVAWADLQAVEIITTAGGPYAEDVFWVLSGSEGGCLVPGSDPGISGLLERVQALPGFDNEQVIRAMGSTGDARFPCWAAPGNQTADDGASETGDGSGRI